MSPFAQAVRSFTFEALRLPKRVLGSRERHARTEVQQSWTTISRGGTYHRLGAAHGTKRYNSILLFDITLDGAVCDIGKAAVRISDVQLRQERAWNGQG